MRRDTWIRRGSEMVTARVGGVKTPLPVVMAFRVPAFTSHRTGWKCVPQSILTPLFLTDNHETGRRSGGVLCVSKLQAILSIIAI